LIHFRIRYEQLRARLEAGRRGTAFVHALSLGLLVMLAAAVAWALGHPGPRLWLWPAAGVCVAAVGWVALARPRSVAELGELLDRRFGLDDLIVTALEVDRRGPVGPLDVHLLDDAASALARIERDPALESGDSARAIESLAGVVCVVAGAWLLAAALTGGASGARLPDLPLAALGFGPGGAEASGWADPNGPRVPGPSAVPPAGAAVRERPAAPGKSSGGTGSSPGPSPAASTPMGTAAATVPATNLAGGGVAGRPGGDSAGGVSGEAAVTGGGGRAAASAAGGSLPWDHREAVRRYFAAP
jgi:hypothetical protein